AAANGNNPAQTGGASAASLGGAEYAQEPIAKPQNLGYSPNYPRLANRPPAAVTAAGTPLIAAPAAGQTAPEYNDWDEDIPQAQARKAVEASSKPQEKKAPVSKPATAKTPAKKLSAPQAPAVVAPGYYVQVGAFGSLENAEKMRARVSSFGSALILPVTVNAKTLYRVRLGPENAKKALEIMDKVTGSGISDARLVEEKGTVPVGKRLDSAF
ncbi:MAG: SPOR domain-containing protein, partial [Alphaproteobacteria bacterium]